MVILNMNARAVAISVSILENASSTIAGRVELSTELRTYLDKLKIEIYQFRNQIGDKTFCNTFIDEIGSSLNPDIWVKTAIVNYVAEWYGDELHTALKQVFSTHLYRCSLSDMVELHRKLNGKIDRVILSAYRMQAIYTKSIEFPFHVAKEVRPDNGSDCIKFDAEFNIVSKEDAPYVYWTDAKDFAQYLRNAAKRN